jgi:FlaG/FlaF family flagellin (archaellin)
MVSTPQNESELIQMSARCRAVFPVLAAVVALFAVGVSNASAAGGPEWLVNGAKLTGSKPIAIAKAGKFNLVLHSTSLNHECKSVSGKGSITSGDPGTGEETLLFKECSVTGYTVKECALESTNKPERSGEIEFTVKTVLVSSGKQEVAYEAFFPAKSGSSLFVQLETQGTKCGVFEEKLYNLSATGTEVSEPAVNNKCGILMEVGEIKTGAEEAFGRTASGATAVKGGLDGYGVYASEVWQSKTETYKAITCKMTFDGGETYLTGIFKVETVPAEAFGWQS